ncbi:prepilin-type N-terminal cleavage/methylation domain-containing protein [Anoxybacillus sp. EFIL]|uniref:prepilin-type N-terminal cleavage/methylation domain-containing protein n=1 Tax=Anoxybacillus sp. EFIL TaxID=2508869 RepID=UPI0005435DC3|nr:prepilin-type N-terminal cleavage/methylation domain-containing protein [Anoxybacillus sp. EFIL]KHF29684.1 hypothetical protein LR68_01468 [Anoxybacillus sp. BCO1]NNU95886.1 prepilin-type N-terminal cleavage/methylation domain-containing protein [Anoxybacillus sp. EFIL]
MLKRFIRNEKGLTLIELLAVIVILGIIAAIAIPSIGAIIDNSKKDAHIANAKQLVNAARIAVTADAANAAKTSFTMKELVDGGYLEKTPKSPGDKLDYDPEKCQVFVTKSQTTGNFSYEVELVDKGNPEHKYIAKKNVDELKRSDVKLE